MAQEGLDYILVRVSENDVPIDDSCQYRFQNTYLGKFMLIVVLSPAVSER
jgi:hypothetical protein